ncbi:diguanylate cyclase [Maridesulfovibrio sp.]|uniref:GGDEF domain-containing response regulator n=1 Tax=Maridesulfovibrio sp. TaxID=2795000 RepID=UPI003AFFBDD6
MSNNIQCPDSGRSVKVLIVEDSITFAGILKRSIQAKLNVEIELCRDYASTVECLKNRKDEFFVALLDIVLPDAPDGEVVDLVVSHDIPSIVFTGEISDELRATMWSKRIVDYVQKVNFDDIEHVVRLVDRLRKNIFSKVLVVDDSSTNRSLFHDLLKVFNFKVVESADGKSALDMVDDEIQLVIAGSDLPDMHGAEFVKELRKKYPKSKLPVICFAGERDASITADVLKAGANDFINSPFATEEFYCRVANTVDTVEYIDTIKKISDNDSLTGILTRSSLFKYGEKLLSQQRRSQASLVAVMLDIHNLRGYNEAHGQFVGDEVIRQVAGMLSRRFRKGDVVSRYGGDAFCLLCADMKLEYVETVFKEIAADIAKTPIETGEHTINANVCVGINTLTNDSLEEMIAGAEQFLRVAKVKGAGTVECGEA